MKVGSDAVGARGVRVQEANRYGSKALKQKRAFEKRQRKLEEKINDLRTEHLETRLYAEDRRGAKLLMHAFEIMGIKPGVTHERHERGTKFVVPKQRYEALSPAAKQLLEDLGGRFGRRSHRFYGARIVPGGLRLEDGALEVWPSK